MSQSGNKLKKVERLLRENERSKPPSDVAFRNIKSLSNFKRFIEWRFSKENAEVIWYNPIDNSGCYLCKIDGEFFRVPHDNQKGSSVAIGFMENLTVLID